MVSFVIYDLTFLVLFTFFIVLFLHKKRKNLQRDGIMYLYRTQIGVKAINYIGEKFKKELHILKYLVISVGYLLMAGMLWLLWKSLYTYFFLPLPKELEKVPPVAPLIPYFPKLFGLQSFFPPFYFTYFLVALAVVAIVHEFSHGIYMKLFKIKIKSTGFAFLGPILGAFVEEDKNQFQKKKNIAQMSVLSAGVFANIIFALIFYLLLIGLFFIAFSPAGYIFSSYAISQAPVNQVTFLDNYSQQKKVVLGNMLFEENLSRVEFNGNNFFVSTELKDKIIKENLSATNNSVLLFYDSPAMDVGLEGIIIQMNDIKIKKREDVQVFLQNKKPGDEITITTLIDNQEKEFKITLGKNPLDESKPYIGIASSQGVPQGFVNKIILSFMKFKNPSTYYIQKIDGNFIIFIYNLFWWIMIINLLVALFNMLPLGILDGGRFFYLTILSITKSKKVSAIAFKIATYIILLLFVLLMVSWMFRFF